MPAYNFKEDLMKKMTALTMDHFLFSGETIGEISILRFKKMPLLHVADLDAKAALFDYLELISSHDDIKVLVIKSAPVKMERTAYINFYKKLIASDDNLRPLELMYNAINQFILQLADLNKIVIHVDRGNVILLFMNIGLACDYRIVADNTVYQNPNIEINVVPKGGSVFYLSKMLGTLTASKILLSREDITAVQAQQMGFVDKVVPLEDLDQVALETARVYAQLPSSYAIGIKKLLNYDLKELNHYLEFENKLLRRQIRSCHLHNYGRLDGTL